MGSAILFESTGGQISKVAHLIELRFALGEPDLDTTSVDTAALKLESNSFFIQKVGADGFKVFHKAKIDKAVHDRKASLDEDSEIRPTWHHGPRGIRTRRQHPGRTVPDRQLVRRGFSPSESGPDGPGVRMGRRGCRAGSNCRLDEETRQAGSTVPGALVWCLRKPGRDLREKVELLLAWRRVQRDVREGILGAEFEKADLQEIAVKVQESEGDAKDEVWASYRFAVLADSSAPNGLKVIDLGAGHSSAAETLCGRIIRR